MTLQMHIKNPHQPNIPDYNNSSKKAWGALQKAEMNNVCYILFSGGVSQGIKKVHKNILGHGYPSRKVFWIGSLKQKSQTRRWSVIWQRWIRTKERFMRRGSLQLNEYSRDIAKKMDLCVLWDGRVSVETMLQWRASVVRWKRNGSSQNFKTWAEAIWDIYEYFWNFYPYLRPHESNYFLTPWQFYIAAWFKSW